MAPSLTERAQAAVENLHVPVRTIDRVFTGFATLAAAWLAFLLIYQLATEGWTSLWAFLPFWLLVTYLILPRIHSLLSRIYLPDYFIGRTRTREGVLGDPVNLALLGQEDQIHAAMLRAGWHRADELNLFTGWRTVRATLSRRSYAEAPVSPLFLFGRRQAFTYQQEVEGNPAKRHHVRFWPTPDGWLLPGGRRVEWLAAGTFDRAVGLSLFTGQITHRIDADIDAERDHIIATLTAPAAGNEGVGVEHLRHFSSGYHHRNGGGDHITTDGDMPIIDVRSLATPSEKLQAQIDVDHEEAAYLRPVPLTVAFAVGLVLVRAIVGLFSLAWTVPPDGGGLLDIPLVVDWLDGGLPLGVLVGISHGLLIAYYVLFGVLGVLVYRGHRWARTAALLLSTLGVIVWAVLWWLGDLRGATVISLLGTALEILAILALSSDTARIYVGSRPGEPERDTSGDVTG
ncbi:LssY C-terminal domain-containing protein [Pseudactinotalea terrae]|uniref:LssY C-terminal domain-containing protein n=1 Tax=Pseudactinotalea terrae TaxID=1743262 RepID=UPI0012E271D5|nr:LssY C-terminal domain-containing protein [Pseudactinotalea terrae]